MTKRFRDLTEKYRSFRLQPDSMYSSRIIQTLFSKFTKKGKKELARQHIMHALSQFRFHLKRPRTFNALLRILQNLRTPFLLVAKRQGKTILDVPIPVRRNKRDVINIQNLYSVVARRRERSLWERLLSELVSLSLFRSQSPTFRQRSQHFGKIYEERVNIDKRWK